MQRLRSLCVIALCLHKAFTILIWGSDREKFGASESEYKSLRVRVGTITGYRGRPEIVTSEQGRIEPQRLVRASFAHNLIYAPYVMLFGHRHIRVNSRMVVT